MPRQPSSCAVSRPEPENPPCRTGRQRCGPPVSKRISRTSLRLEIPIVNRDLPSTTNGGSIRRCSADCLSKASGRSVGLVRSLVGGRGSRTACGTRRRRGSARRRILARNPARSHSYKACSRRRLARSWWADRRRSPGPRARTGKSCCSWLRRGHRGRPGSRLGRGPPRRGRTPPWGTGRLRTCTGSGRRPASGSRSRSARPGSRSTRSCRAARPSTAPPPAP